jgi:hypothetical protein
MKIIEVDTELPTIGSQGHARSGGLHVTDVIRSLLDSVGLIKRTASNWNMDVTVAAGFLFEEVLARYIIPESERIGEVSRDGIACSPDGFDIDEWILDEIKFTWKSSNNLPQDNIQWMMQIMAYCYVMQTLEARLWVYYVMGQYKGGGPEFKCFKITFEAHEIAENWDRIVKHATTMER